MHTGRLGSYRRTSAPLPHYVRDIFAGPEMTGLIQNEPDPVARVIGRCFASFIAKRLSSDTNARSGGKVRFRDAELGAILGSGSASGGLQQPEVIGLANTSFTSVRRNRHLARRQGATGPEANSSRDGRHSRDAGSKCREEPRRWLWWHNPEGLSHDPIRVTVVGLTMRWRRKAA